MDSEIKQYEQQLEQVVQGLKADPDNVDLAALRDELANLISLTRSLASEQAGSSSSAGQPSQPKAAAKTTSAPPVHPATTSKVAGGTNQPSQAVQLSAGSECLAKYAADGRWYPARVTSVSGSAKDPVYSITFKGYNETAMLRSADVKPSSSSSSAVAASSSHAASGISATTASSAAKGKGRGTPVLSAEEEAERERKRKRSEKKAERHEIKTQVATDKANSWQKFAKKGQKKGYGIAGAGSMFKTPDDPLAKVGVVGAGRGMTQYQDRSKHVYQP